MLKVFRITGLKLLFCTNLRKTNYDNNNKNKIHLETKTTSLLTKL